MTRGYTTRPDNTLRPMMHTASAARNASGIERRLLAESSSVRSNHCSAAVFAGDDDSEMM